jgi:hypothetical protein
MTRAKEQAAGIALAVNAMRETDEQFKNMVRYFYEEKGNPERYSGWDEERCKRLMPMFHEAWSKSNLYAGMALLALDKESA